MTSTKFYDPLQRRTTKSRPITEDMIVNDGFSLGSQPSYAYTSPNTGLIFVLWFDSQPPAFDTLKKVFPEEEFVHSLSISRNPIVISEALSQYWDFAESVATLQEEPRPDRPRGTKIVLNAWRPVFEALSDIYQQSIDNKTRIKNKLYATHIILNFPFNEETARDTHGPRIATSEALSLDDYSDVEQIICANMQKQMRELLETLINEYLAGDLLTTDIKHLKREDPEALYSSSSHVQNEDQLRTYQLIETYITYELYKLGLLVLDREPVDFWDAVITILEQWCNQAAKGESPFPVEDQSLLQIFVSEWCTAVCSILRMLPLTLQIKPQVAASSIPALYHVLNPYLIDYTVLCTPTRRAHLLFPSIIIPVQHPFIYHFTVFNRPSSTLTQTYFEECPLYPNLTPWRYGQTNDESTAEPDGFIQNATQQIMEYTLRLEDLWLYHDSKPSCQHCQHLLKLIDMDPLLPQLLENRVFTDIQKGDQVAALNNNYHQWLNNEILAIHHKFRS